MSYHVPPNNLAALTDADLVEWFITICVQHGEMNCSSDVARVKKEVLRRLAKKAAPIKTL